MQMNIIYVLGHWLIIFNWATYRNVAIVFLFQFCEQSNVRQINMAHQSLLL